MLVLPVAVLVVIAVVSKVSASTRRSTDPVAAALLFSPPLPLPATPLRLPLQPLPPAATASHAPPRSVDYSSFPLSHSHAAVQKTRARHHRNFLFSSLFLFLKHGCQRTGVAQHWRGGAHCAMERDSPPTPPPPHHLQTLLLHLQHRRAAAQRGPPGSLIAWPHSYARAPPTPRRTLPPVWFSGLVVLLVV